MRKQNESNPQVIATALSTLQAMGTAPLNHQTSLRMGFLATALRQQTGCRTSDKAVAKVLDAAGVPRVDNVGCVKSTIWLAPATWNRLQRLANDEMPEPTPPPSIQKSLLPDPDRMFTAKPLTPIRQATP